MSDVTVCRLLDNKLSVRLHGVEVYILPSRIDCTEDDIARMLNAMLASHEVDMFDEEVGAKLEGERRDMLRDLSKW